MASAVFHIKDSYYFELPAGLTPDITSMDQVPGWLKVQHEHATLSDFQHELDGKILIPSHLVPPGPCTREALTTPVSAFRSS